MDKLEQLGLPVSEILKLLLIRIIGLVNCLVGPSVVKMNKDSWYTRSGFIWWGGRWLATRCVPVDVSKAKRLSWVTSVWDSWSRQ